MAKRILITGGAGFIGSHLADELLHHGYHVRILDPRAILAGGPAPDDVERFRGPVEDVSLLLTALDGVDAVVHLAARPDLCRAGFGGHSSTTGHAGTPILLEALLHHPVERLVIASGSCTYGEGLYRDLSGTLVVGEPRSPDQLRRGAWDLRDAAGSPLTPQAIPETCPLSLTSACALSRYDHERMCLLVGRARAIPVTILRFFHVYGPRQVLDSPQAGVLPLFAAQLLAGAAPLVFEDGRQLRDFVDVRDAARACRLAVEAPDAADRIINIGSGECLAVADLARQLARILGRDLEPDITRRHRPGDIRHRVADISLARRLLGYVPRIRLTDGLVDFASWFENQARRPAPSSPAFQR